MWYPLIKPNSIFFILNGHELDSKPISSTLILNFDRPISVIIENHNNQKNFIFDKNTIDIVLRYLNNELNIILTTYNIQYHYHNFTTTLSTSINKFSTMVSHRNENIMTNHCYDKEFNHARKFIMCSSNKSL